MQQQRRRLDRSVLLIGISIGSLLAATPALAQSAPPATVPPQPGQSTNQSPPPQTPPPDITVGSSGTDAALSSPNTIVVTGTRIRQPEFTSPDPVSRIDPAIAQREGKIDIADTLQSSPIAAGSVQITSALSSNLVTNGGPGSETIDLRGLGPNRTLVLLNGRRAGPAGTRGGVSAFDLNVLPQSIISRVDILKTGASSVYGSDAIAGVVNLITKTDFSGLQLDAYGTFPTYRGGSGYTLPFPDSAAKTNYGSGGNEYTISLLAGKKWDRGHFMIAVDYHKQKELARGDRDYLGCPEAYIFRQGNPNERADLVDPRTGHYHCEDFPVGQVWTYDLDYFAGRPGNLFNNRGAYTATGSGVTLFQFQYPGETLNVPPIGCPRAATTCFGTPPGWFPTGYDAPTQAIQDDFSPYNLEQSIIPITKRYTVYADGSYEFNDNIEGYAEFLANRRYTYQHGWRQIWVFGGTSDYAGAPTFWAPGWTGYNLLSPLAATNHSDSAQTVDYYRGVGGLRGDLGGFLKGWSYDTYVQYSHNKGVYRTEQFLQDIYDVSSYQTASCVGTVLPRSGKQCMDLPWTDPNFLLGHFTPAQADYMFDWEKGTTIYKQLSAEGSITGNLFDLPAGAVGVALGLTARRDEILDTPGLITQAGDAWGASTSGITAGHEITKEAFGEIQVPILKERPFFRDLSFSGAARITFVKAVQAGTGATDEDKGNWTYKLGGNWAVNSWLRFRGTYGTSFRAPALFEEFKSPETSFPSARSIDPCVDWAFHLGRGDIDQRVADNCASQGIPGNYAGGSISANVFSQGGVGKLAPETSTAKTASVILTPRFSFLPSTRLSLAVDYFDIEVKNEVSQLGAGTIIFGCYESDNFPNDPLCSLFTRGQGVDPLAINTVSDQYINIASQRNKGIDFTGLIEQDLGSYGHLTFHGNATYQLTDKKTLLPTSPVQGFNGDIGDPAIVADLNLTWRSRAGGWSLFWGSEMIGKSSNDKKVEQVNGGSLCHPFDPADTITLIWGSFCLNESVPTTWYHSASVTKEFGSPAHRLEVTLGMRNIFDTHPPRVSTIGGGSGLPTLIGPIVAASQYDLIGRRVFLNITKKF
jgi:iron complex outermembrane receptor protein